MNRREIQLVFFWAAVVMLVTSVPYFVAWFLTPRDGVFPGLLFNADDHGVYFAWMRQAQDGHLLFRNLFTTEPQRGIYLHLYFLALGGLAKVPGLSIPLAYHIGRILFGTLTLFLVYRLAALISADTRVRWCAFWTTALSAGLGWLDWADTGIQQKSVDVWQPEALTFPSLYTNGLFCVSLALMLGVVVCLLLAEQRRPIWAVGAGVCGLLLGNIHSYDVIHLAAVWFGFLVVRWCVNRQFSPRPLGIALIAAATAAPSVAHMAWLYATEPVFKARADTATLTPALWKYVVGYGLLLPLAAWGGWLLTRRKSVEGREDPHQFWLLPVVWAVVGIAVAYLPFAFQRKLIMGYHFPLGLLAGVAVADLSARLALRAGKPRIAIVFAALLIAVLTPSNIRYMERDLRLALTQNISSTGIHPTFWITDNMRAFEWLGKNSPANAALLTWPFNGVLAPAYSGRAVYAGHWGETPQFPAKVPEVLRFYRGTWSSEERLAFLQKHRITHVLEGPYERGYVESYAQQSGLAPGRPLRDEPFLTPVWQQGEVVLYQVAP